MLYRLSILSANIIVIFICNDWWQPLLNTYKHFSYLAYLQYMQFLSIYILRLIVSFTYTFLLAYLSYTYYITFIFSPYYINSNSKTYLSINDLYIYSQLFSFFKYIISYHFIISKNIRQFIDSFLCHLLS